MADQIGEYKRKIAIWKRTGAVDAAGEPLPDSFEFYKFKWAKIRGRNGM